MSDDSILTPAQAAILLKYCKKWREIALSYDRLASEQVTSAIASIYAHLHLPTPSILFFPSPDSGFQLGGLT